MTPDELANKARLAWLNADGPSSHDDWCKAVAVALEEAAKVADWPYPASEGWGEEMAGRIAAAEDIRALKDKE